VLRVLCGEEVSRTLTAEIAKIAEIRILFLLRVLCVLCGEEISRTLTAEIAESVEISNPQRTLRCKVSTIRRFAINRR
jgi:hypothetical protein